MSATGKARAQINTAARLLKELGLLDDHNEWTNYPPDLPALARSMSYVDEFRHYANNRLFDLSLVDHSLFQFKPETPDNVSYCYYQAPFEVPTYQEFVADQLGDDLTASEDIGDLFRDEYEQVIDTARLRQGVTPIRYDYSPSLYEAGVHPAAHLHIGMGNELRIFARRLMHPLSFVLFVLRHLYPGSWRALLAKEDAPVICRAVRDELEMVDAAYLQERDRYSLILE